MEQAAPRRFKANELGNSRRSGVVSDEDLMQVADFGVIPGRFPASTAKILVGYRLPAHETPATADRMGLG